MMAVITLPKYQAASYVEQVQDRIRRYLKPNNR